MNNSIYLFLDIDGVLATTRQFYSKKLHPKHNCYRFDPKCTTVFNNIFSSYNIVIIISSDWKDDYSIDDFNEIFEWNGIKFKVDDVTPSLWDIKYKSLQELEACRANEIQDYITEHHIEKFIIIDDLDLSPWFPDNFIRTPRVMEGIKQSGIKEKILTKLNTF